MKKKELKNTENTKKRNVFNCKYSFLIIIALFLTILLINNISSLGVTPGSKVIDYKPGETRKVSFSILNTDNEEMDLIVSRRGDLKDKVSLDQRKISLSSDEESKEVSYSINMSKDMKPGEHTGEVMIIQQPSDREKEGTQVGASLAVITQIKLHVPYPGKYAETDLSVEGGSEGEEIKFHIPVINRGKFDLTDVKANIDIYNPVNEKIDSISTKGIDIPNGKRDGIKASWKADVNPGKYRAVLNLRYGEDSGDVLTEEEVFKIGNQTLEVQSFEVDDFSLGEIAKIKMLVENKGAGKAEDAHIETEVYKEEELMSQFKSASKDIPPMSKKELISYWDTAGVNKGMYDTKLNVKHAEESIEENIKLEVNEDEINAVGLGYVISEQEESDDKTLVIVLVVLVIVLMIVNIWFLFLRKKLLGKK